MSKQALAHCPLRTSEPDEPWTFNYCVSIGPPKVPEQTLKTAKRFSNNVMPDARSSSAQNRTGKGKFEQRSRHSGAAEASFQQQSFAVRERRF